MLNFPIISRDHEKKSLQVKHSDAEIKTKQAQAQFTILIPSFLGISKKQNQITVI